jgi:hypothetical protein
MSPQRGAHHKTGASRLPPAARSVPFAVGGDCQEMPLPPFCDGLPEVLPLRTVGCRLCAGPGDNRRAQLIPACDSLYAGSQSPSKYRRLFE